MSDSSLDQSRNPKNVKKVLIWIMAVVVSLIVAFFGVRTLLINNAVAGYQEAFENQFFEDARESIESLRQLDPENPLVETGTRDIEIAELELQYISALKTDDLETARMSLDKIAELAMGSFGNFEKYDQELDVLENSKRAYQVGISSLEDGEIEGSILLLKRVSVTDQLRYADAQLRLAEASKLYVNQLWTSVRKLVSKNFYISAYLEMEEARELLGPMDGSLAEVNSWFNERFESAKESALRTQMAVRKDSFTGQVSYYYKPTYVTC
jgi:hypothetical protein